MLSPLYENKLKNIRMSLKDSIEKFKIACKNFDKNKKELQEKVILK